MRNLVVFCRVLRIFVGLVSKVLWRMSLFYNHALGFFS